MPISNKAFPTTRRRALKLMALMGLGSGELARSAGALAATAGKADAQWPEMTYRTLGKTGFEGSRLVFGCGAALMFFGKKDLLSAAYEHGVNVFDVGTSAYYRNAETNLAAFARARRDKIFLISKGLVGLDIQPGDELTTAQCRTAANNWGKSMEQSLKDLGTDHVNAYYIMAGNNVSLIRSEEMRAAFEKAKAAGRVDHWGVSTHQNAKAVLEAAADTGAYSLAQIAVTPAGWYDWNTKSVLSESPPMNEIQPVLEKARQAGIGLIGMKAARHMAGKWMGLGPDKQKAFDSYYNKNLMAAPFSGFQRSYAYVLAHGLDAVNADSQSIEHLQENFIAAATSQNYFS